MAALERILVPTDFSAGSHAALGYALFLAARLGGAVEALHVYEAPAGLDPDSTVQVPGSEKPQKLGNLLRTQAEDKLRNFLSDIPGAQGVRIESRIEVGEPAETIVRVAREERFDLIAMGTRGLSGFTRLMVGSVLEKVIHDAPCPVLAVRVKE